MGGPCRASCLFWKRSFTLGQASGLETAAAAARLDGVRVIEGESATVDRFMEVDRGSVEVQVALLVDRDLHAVLFGTMVF
jgi:hypothetical protein